MPYFWEIPAIIATTTMTMSMMPMAIKIIEYKFRIESSLLSRHYTTDGVFALHAFPW
jgi:Na+/H+ antiporter NhaC